MGLLDLVKSLLGGKAEKKEEECCSCGEPQSVNAFAGTCSNPDCEVYGKKVCVVCADKDDDNNAICLYCEQKLSA